MEGQRSWERPRDDKEESIAAFDVDKEESIFGEMLDASVRDVDSLGKKMERVPQELQDRAMASYSYAEQGLRNYRLSRNDDERKQSIVVYRKGLDQYREAHQKILDFARSLS